MPAAGRTNRTLRLLRFTVLRGFRYRPLSKSGITRVFRLKAVDITMLTPAQTLENSPPRKTTLYCPECGHESLINGDWRVRVHGDCADYDCPECGMTITSRPIPDLLMVISDGRSYDCLTI